MSKRDIFIVACILAAMWMIGINKDTIKALITGGLAGAWIMWKIK